MSAPKHKGWWSSWYKRDGTPCASQDEARAIQKQNRVALDTVLDGRIVSTVHLGLDHRFGVGAPIIFETLVFPKAGDFTDIDSARYCTEAEAVAGHAAMVAKWSKPGATGYGEAATTPPAKAASAAPTLADDAEAFLRDLLCDPDLANGWRERAADLIKRFDAQRKAAP